MDDNGVLTFPIQPAFKEWEGSFKMREISKDDAQDVPETAADWEHSKG